MRWILRTPGSAWKCREMPGIVFLPSRARHIRPHVFHSHVSCSYDPPPQTNCARRSSAMIGEQLYSFYRGVLRWLGAALETGVVHSAQCPRSGSLELE